jgi:hypothetical protein
LLPYDFSGNRIFTAVEIYKFWSRGIDALPFGYYEPITVSGQINIANRINV